MRTVAVIDKQWQAEADLETMIRYDEICRDPKRKAAAKALAKKKLDGMQSVIEPKGDKRK